MAVLTIDGVIPWDRFCSSICFRAAIWSGTAPVFGLVAEVSAAAFVIVSLVRRRWSSLSTAQLALGAVAIASVGVKVGLMIRDAAILLTGENVARPIYVGAWLGLTLAALAFITLVSLLLGPERSLRRLLVIVVVFALLGGAAVPYALSGFGWWGGPLSPPKDFGLGAGLGQTNAKPGQPYAFDGSAYVHNGGWTTATLDRVILLHADSGLRLVASYLVLPSLPHRCPQGSTRIPFLGYCGVPVRGYRVGTGPPGNDLKIVLLLEAASFGAYSARGVKIDYHIGPVHFSVIQSTEFTVCASSPNVRCHA